MSYSTMLHTILAYRCVLQVLRSSRSDGTEYPTIPGSYGTSISRSQTVSRSVRTCGARWGQVQGCSPALRGALPLVALGKRQEARQRR